MQTILEGHLRSYVLNSGENMLKIATKKYKENIDLLSMENSKIIT